MSNTSGDWVFHIEDDAIIGPLFSESLNLLGGTRLSAVSFFSLRYREPGLHRVQWSSTVCFAVRPSVMRGASEYATRWYAKNPQHTHASDLILRDWFRDKKVAHATYFPSLVQHRDGPSTLGRRSSQRMSPTYVD